MSDSVVILLIIFVVLIIVQVAALLRLKYLVRQLDCVLLDIKRLGFLKKGMIRVLIPNCQNCVYRQTFIKTVETGEDEFYYYCKLHRMDVSLKFSCKQFEPDTSA